MLRVRCCLNSRLLRKSILVMKPFRIRIFLFQLMLIIRTLNYWWLHRICFSMHCLDWPVHRLLLKYLWRCKHLSKLITARHWSSSTTFANYWLTTWCSILLSSECHRIGRSILARCYYWPGKLILNKMARSDLKVMAKLGIADFLQRIDRIWGFISIGSHNSSLNLSLLNFLPIIENYTLLKIFWRARSAWRFILNPNLSVQRWKPTSIYERFLFTL